MAKVLYVLFLSMICIGRWCQAQDNTACQVDIDTKFKACNELIEDQTVTIQTPLMDALTYGNFTNLGEIVRVVCAGFTQASACLDVHSTQCPSDYSNFFQTFVKAYKICAADDITKYFKDFFECNHKAGIYAHAANVSAEVQLEKLGNITASTGSQLMDTNCQFLRKMRKRVSDAELLAKCGADDQQGLAKLYGQLTEAFGCNSATAQRGFLSFLLLALFVSLLSIFRNS
ncbi:uncharacterized protein LOC129584398 [Paramacrobiotus metropolitanus]|uniref:uncharacterized protein LOC129584398 n=1 Tax=Paramacrobiotus metropolitanus TaxID=2943436 RepID=UPI002445BA53|nr:uncharacterized protein LOC129584398 [Paramacrobiotus metropolitanus]